MTDTLLHAYVPLIVWTSLGLILVQFLPDSFPRLLGRSLYWVGVPVQIFTLARQTAFDRDAALVPAIALLGLLIGLVLASLGLWYLQRRWVLATPPPNSTGGVIPEAGAIAEPDLETAAPVVEQLPDQPWLNPARRGGFMLSSILGNTGFVGLAVVPSFVAEPYRGWIVLYSVTHNLIGTYGIGVLLASFYARSHGHNPWFKTFRDILTVPSLWAFAIGLFSRRFAFPNWLEMGFRGSLWVIIPAALLLMGIRLRQIQGWQGLKRGIVPALIKMLGIPMSIGLITGALHLPADPRLALVLMAGMPTAFAGLILSEEYELERELIASSIVISTLMLFLTIPLWILLWGVP